MLLRATVVLPTGDNRPRAETLLSCRARPFPPLRSYIGGRYCHSKGDQNELPKYLRYFSRATGIYIDGTNPWQFHTIFHHSWNEIKGFNCERLRRIFRYEIYVLIDLDRYFPAHVQGCNLFTMLFSARISQEFEKRERAAERRRYNIDGIVPFNSANTAYFFLWYFLSSRAFEK